MRYLADKSEAQDTPDTIDNAKKIFHIPLLAS
jgi:hypothetical protein